MHLAVAGSALRVAGSLVAAPSWHDVAPWTHSWDALDAQLYTDDGEAWDIAPAVRVDTIPDGSDNGRPMFRDQGPHGAIFLQPPLPGCLWVPDTDRFGGRPAWHSDRVLLADSYFLNWHSMLSPLTDKDDPDDFFAWANPWWQAMLLHFTPGQTGREVAALDGDPGMTTIEGYDPNNGYAPGINVSAWIGGHNTGPYLTSTVPPYSDRSILLMTLKDGASSWLDITWRDDTGDLQTQRVSGPLGGSNPMNTLHTGWSHSNSMTCLGLAHAAPTDAQVEAVRTWAAPYLTAL